MPPISPSPQGSRAGLITSLVIFVVLFATATVLAIYYNTQWEAALKLRTADASKVEPYVGPSDISNEDVNKILNDSTKPKSSSVVAYAIAQRGQALNLVVGTPAATLDQAKAEVHWAITEANANVKAANEIDPDAGVAFTPDEVNLVKSVKSLSAMLPKLTQQIVDEKKKTTDFNAQKAAMLKDKDDAVAAEVIKTTKALADATATDQKYKDRQAAITDELDKMSKESAINIKSATDATTAAQNELSKVQTALKKSQDEYLRLKTQLARYRLNPTRSLLQPPGTITRVPGDNTVYISLGQGDQITPGLTFEVYDKLKGLPSLTAANTTNSGDELPAGKASIEVIRVMPGTSECRIIHKAPGYEMVEGDLILNLIYNTHTKFAFTVYGEFDLANNSQPNAADGDVLRRLVSQWGGRLMDSVNVETDFLVLGKEPAVYPLPDNPSAIDIERHGRQQAALDKYQTVKSEATNLNIPILNQNRFLYFVGYYDQAKR